MALKRFGVGRGQLELNNVFFRREGAIEAQCALDPTKFATEGNEGNGKVYAENGMILAVDKANGIVTLPGEDEFLPLALNYSTEHMYDERHKNLGSYYLPAGTFYPRMGYLKKGEVFTTNCVEYTAESEEALRTAFQTTDFFGIPGATGRIQLVEEAATKDARLVLKAVKYYTMPDGTPGIKFQVVKA